MTPMLDSLFKNFKKESFNRAAESFTQPWNLYSVSNKPCITGKFWAKNPQHDNKSLLKVGQTKFDSGVS